ncbi:MAG: hypothetical protein GY757_39885, partial [bacterium]|nr:hypothetical protein [bacterium]
VLKIRIDEHGIQKGKVNLLESYYHRISYRDFAARTGGCYKAFDTESLFFLVAHEDSVKIELNLTCRVPLMKSDDNHIFVKINESEPIELTVCDKWENYTLHLPEKAVKKGINKIVIQWPMDIDIKKNWKKDVAMHRKVLTIMYPVYGEIHMLTASKID